MTKELLWTTSSATQHTLGKRSISYDAVGRRTKQRFESENRTAHLNLDTATSFAYHSSKQWLDRIQRQGSATEKADYSYDDADGRLTKMSYGNGARSEYAYYASGALSKISHFNTTGTLIASVGYEYDKAGNVTKCALDDSLTYHGDATVTYEYDDLHRLTREYCAPAQGSCRTGYDYRYTYDAVGNRTNKISGSGSGRYLTQYSYGAQNELGDENTYEVVEVWNEETEQWEEEWNYQGGYTYGYDYRGNLTGKTYYDSGWSEAYHWAYDWSCDDKLTKVYYGQYIELPDATIQYKYDLLGRRVAKKVNSGNWRWYFYDGLQVEAEGTGTSDKIYYTHSPSAIGGIIARDANGTKYWYHYDRLGNVMAVTDSNGALVAGYTMEAFGNVLEVGTSTGYNATQSDPQPYHLTTKEYDGNIGLYYFNARWYDGGTGRFISKDPDRFFNGDGKYVYCHNDPTNSIDPWGLRNILYGAGHLCISTMCRNCQDSYVMPEDWHSGADIPNIPCTQTGNAYGGKYNCVEADAFYRPSGILKITDNATCFLECGYDGFPLDNISCFVTWAFGKKPQWYPPDQPPPGWPTYEDLFWGQY